MSVIVYASGAPALFNGLASPYYQSAAYSFDAEDDAQFVPVNQYFEAAALTDVQVITGFFQEADDATRVVYHEQDSAILPFQPGFNEFALIVTDDDEYFNGDGNTDEGYASRGNADLTQCDLGIPHWVLTGTTRDSTGAVLTSCAVHVMDTATDVLVKQITSDPSTGVYTLGLFYTGPFYVTAYKAGAPDVAGTTVNTLVPAPQ